VDVRHLPGSVQRSIWVVRALVVWGALSAVLTVVLRDDLILTWARGNQAAREVLGESGLEGLKQSSIRIPGFATLAVVLFVVYAALAGVLLAFLGAGHAWARYALSATAVFTAFALVVGLARNLPVLFSLLSVVALLLNGALLWFLWQRDTDDFFHVT
jgi:hypothetical protein